MVFPLTFPLTFPGGAAPVANNDSYQTKDNTTLNVAAPGVLINDTDPVPGPDPLTAIEVTTTSHGALTLNSDGSFEYIPDLDYNGLDSFTYKCYDGDQYSGNATVTIAVASKDMFIYYRLDATPPGDEEHLNCWCSCWNRNNYELTIETTLNNTERDLLFDNVYPGAVTELFDVLGEKYFVDTTWQDKNSLILQQVSTFHLKEMHRKTKVAVKSISYENLNRWHWRIKIICIILEEYP